MKVYLVADPAVRARPPAGRAARDRRRRARDRPQAARRVRPGADAAAPPTRIEIDTTELGIDDVIARIEGLVRAHAGRLMAYGDFAWRTSRLLARAAHVARYAGSRPTGASGSRAAAAACSRSTTSPGSTSRVVGAQSPRNINFVAKVELRGVPGFGAVPRLARDHRRPARRVRPRRGAADARARRATAGRSASSSRARGSGSGRPGHVQPGAAMVAIQEDVPVVPIAVYGTQFWKPGNFAPCSIAVGEPFLFEGLPEGRQGLQGGERRDRAAAERPLRLARRACTPAAGPTRRWPRRCERRPRARGEPEPPSRPARHGRDRRLPERRQVDADQPADRDAAPRSSTRRAARPATARSSSASGRASGSC